jgi:hypothetical protein
MYELFTLLVNNSHGYRQQSHYPCSVPLGFSRLVPASDIYVRALGKLVGNHSTEYVTLAFPFWGVNCFKCLTYIALRIAREQYTSKGVPHPESLDNLFVCPP